MGLVIWMAGMSSRCEPLALYMHCVSPPCGSKMTMYQLAFEMESNSKAGVCIDCGLWHIYVLHI